MGLPNTDYYEKACNGLNISMNQINQVQNNTYFGNFSNMAQYYDSANGFTFIGNQNTVLYYQGVDTQYLLNKQMGETQTYMQTILANIQYVQQQNVMIYN